MPFTRKGLTQSICVHICHEFLKMVITASYAAAVLGGDLSYCKAHTGPTELPVITMQFAEKRKDKQQEKKIQTETETRRNERASLVLLSKRKRTRDVSEYGHDHIMFPPQSHHLISLQDRNHHVISFDSALVQLT